MAYGNLSVDSITTSTPQGVLGAGNASLIKNRLINSGFTINQRTYVSNTALAVGVYGHDRWKAGASGCTYTFTQLSAGVPIVITITAGSIQQVIEGCNIPDGGNFVLSWTGTAQGRFNGGTYGSSPLAVTGLTAGANCTIEFNTGTLSYPQLEVGSVATGFEYEIYSQTLAKCQRYYEVVGTVALTTVTANYQPVYWAVSKRASPTVTTSAATGTFAAFSATTLASYSGAFQSSPNSSDINVTVTGSAEL